MHDNDPYRPHYLMLYYVYICFVGVCILHRRGPVLCMLFTKAKANKKICHDKVNKCFSFLYISQVQNVPGRIFHISANFFIYIRYRMSQGGYSTSLPTSLYTSGKECHREDNPHLCQLLYISQIQNVPGRIIHISVNFFVYIRYIMSQGANFFI